ncbi:WGR domain-containing protein [Metabacillus sp. HB246100]
MIKMTKQVDDEVLYWEVWQDGKTLVIHYGTIGDTGETEEKKLSLFQKAEKFMDELAEEKANEGYDYLDEDELFELVVQYSYEEDQMEATLEMRHHVEDLMNECLGWTGNGACDGGDIGSGTANIVNFVVDVEKATQTIIEELKNNNLLEGVKIAYLNPEDEEYIALYPEGADFDLM